MGLGTSRWKFDSRNNELLTLFVHICVGMGYKMNLVFEELPILFLSTDFFAVNDLDNQTAGIAEEVRVQLICLMYESLWRH